MFATIIGSFVVMTLNVSEIFIKKKNQKSIFLSFWPKKASSTCIHKKS